MSVFIDPATKDWREQLASRSSPGSVLAVQVRFLTETLDLLWVKPSLVPDLPPDLATYSLANPAFRSSRPATSSSTRRSGNPIANSASSACATPRRLPEIACTAPRRDNGSYVKRRFGSGGLS